MPDADEIAGRARTGAELDYAIGNREDRRSERRRVVDAGMRARDVQDGVAAGGREAGRDPAELEGRREEGALDRASIRAEIRAVALAVLVVDDRMITRSPGIPTARIFPGRT